MAVEIVRNELRARVLGVAAGAAIGGLLGAWRWEQAGLMCDERALTCSKQVLWFGSQGIWMVFTILMGAGIGLVASAAAVRSRTASPTPEAGGQGVAQRRPGPRRWLRRPS